jgi:hypothetical protein
MGRTYLEEEKSKQQFWPQYHQQFHPSMMNERTSFKPNKFQKLKKAFIIEYLSKMSRFVAVVYYNHIAHHPT